MFNYPLPIPANTLYQELGVDPEAPADEVRNARTDVINALKDGPSLEAVVSFDVRWTGGGGHFKERDDTNHFEGRYVEVPGTHSFCWRARSPNPANRAKPMFSTKRFWLGLLS